MSCAEKWQGIKYIKNDFQPNVYARTDKNGRPVRLDQRAEATAEYLDDVQWKPKDKGNDILDVSGKVNEDLRHRRMDDPKPQIDDGPITMDELDRVVRKLKRNKSPGPDDITTDWVKDLDAECRQLLLELLNEWWNNESMTEEMDQARVASLYKKGDPKKQENYRPISLLNVFYKIIAAVIHKRLEAGLDERIHDTQFGFRKSKATTQALFTARRIQEFAERAGLPGAMIFLDWEKEFDKLDHQKLLEVLWSYNIPEKLYNLIKHIYTAPKFQVNIEGVRSQWHRQKAGIRQGCPLSPYLFILVMNRVFQQVHKLKHVYSMKFFGAPSNP